MPDVAIKSDAGNRPPVLSSLSNQAERDAFIAYIEQQSEKTPVEAAAAESKRLAYYWNALDKRLTRAGPVEKGGEPKKRPSLFSFLIPKVLHDYKPVDRYQSGDLPLTFNKVAQSIRNIVLAEVMISPLGLRQHTFIENLQSEGRIRGGTNKTRLSLDENDSRGYDFGFIELLRLNEQSRHSWDKYSSALAIPVLHLDDDMMDKAAEHNATPMLRHLQTIISLCNHDMMHNMVNTISKADISQLHEAPYKPEIRLFMEHKTGQYSEDHPLGFESALVIGHAHTWNDLKNTETGVVMKHAVEGYYDELARIAGELPQDMPAAERHKVVDYFGMAVPFALARMIPLNDPLMERAFERMQRADPAPETVMAQNTHLADLMANPVTKRTLENYKQSGQPLAFDDAALSYPGIKKLQLVMMMPDTVLLMSPAQKGSPEYKAHARADEMDRDIINIVSRGIHPGI